MKVCLIGSAPSSVRLAPYSDPSYEIWACSPGAYPHLSPARVNAFFECHRWEPPDGYTGPKNWFTTDYIKFLASLKCPVYMIEPVPEIPTSVAYPKDEMLDKFGPYFFTSSLSWMLALAIHQGAKEITLFGVDMSATDEWEFQRSGCHYFISIARALGIKVTVPPESDLLRPPPLYGFAEVDPMHIKLLTRRAELEARMRDAEGRYRAAEQEIMFIKGAMENNTYTIKTWVSDLKAIAMAYANPVQQPAPVMELPAEIPMKPNGAVPLQPSAVASQDAGW